MVYKLELSTRWMHGESNPGHLVPSLVSSAMTAPTARLTEHSGDKFPLNYNQNVYKIFQAVTQTHKYYLKEIIPVNSPFIVGRFFRLSSTSCTDPWINSS